MSPLLVTDVPVVDLPDTAPADLREVFERTSAADLVVVLPVVTPASLLPVEELVRVPDLSTEEELSVLTRAFVFTELRPELVLAYNFSPSTLKSGRE